MPQFQRLNLEGWRQFNKVELEFHPQLTVLTGANGSGKSTILSLLSLHFGWPRQFLATPSKTKGDSGYKYFSGAEHETDDPTTREITVGSLTYADAKIAIITVPRNVPAAQYSIQFQQRQEVEGVYVTQHRPLEQYQRVESIPTEPMLPALAFTQWLEAIIQRYGGGYTPKGPLYKMKQALISMAMFGPGNQFAVPIPEISKAFEGFVQILHTILPDTLGFKEISIRTPDIVFVTETGEWLLDEASGGISAIIELAWEIFLYSSDRNNFVVLIDEPENHLHPAMQRVLMNKLVAAFPRVQFIVATHSPFIVSSVKDSAVYVLRYSEEELVPPIFVGNPPSLDEGGVAIRDTDDVAETSSGVIPPSAKRRIVSEQLDLVAKAGTASEILRDVLGVPVAVPEWVAADVASVVEEFRSGEVTADSLRALRSKLEGLGMGDRFPEAVSKLVVDQ